MPDQVPPDVVKDRFQRLLRLQERLSLEANRALLGTEVELLVEQATSKNNPTRMSGRTRTNKLCHFPALAASPAGDRGGPGSAVTGDGPAVDGQGTGRPVGAADGDRSPGRAGPAAGPVDPGDLVTVRVEQAAPHHLIGGAVLGHRRRRAAETSCGSAPPPRPLPAGAVPLPLVG